MMENSDVEDTFSVVNPLGQEGSSLTSQGTTTTFEKLEILKDWTEHERKEYFEFEIARADKELAIEREKTARADKELVRLQLELRLAEIQQASVQPQVPTIVQPQGPNEELQTARIPQAEPYFFERGKYGTFNISLIQYFPNSFFA